MDDPARRHTMLIGTLVATLLALPIYVLSFGPALWLLQAGYIPRPVMLLYFPLIWLADNTDIGEPIRRYAMQFLDL